MRRMPVTERRDTLAIAIAEAIQDCANVEEAVEVVSEAIVAAAYKMYGGSAEDFIEALTDNLL